MRIAVHPPKRKGLLLCGVPLAPGAMPAGAGLTLKGSCGTSIPLWWDERAYWPDGSVKWIFLHARLEEECEAATLVVGEGSPRSLPGMGRSSLEIEGVRLELGPTAWTFAAAGQVVHLRPGIVETEPALASAGAYSLEMVEASGIAPLVRWRQTGTTGLRFDHLLRVDPVAGALYWQQRVSFLTEEAHRLQFLAAEVESEKRAWLWEIDGRSHQHLLVLQPGKYALDHGQEQEGRPPASLRGETLSVVLEKGWQRAPFALTAAAGQVRIDFYPREARPLTVQGGTSFRHAVRLGLKGEGGEISWSLDPETACGSGAFGPLMACTPRTRRLFPGYEQAIETGLQSSRLSQLDKEPDGPQGLPVALADEISQDEEYFGLQHYGDWPMKLGAYGGKRRIYADNEYDVPFAYFLQFARTGRPEYREVAYHSAVHMADVDCKATNGDLRFHGYYDQAEDHVDHRPSGGELGHYWTDGLVLNYLLCGDWWSWEAAQSQVCFLLERFAGEGDDAIRRHFLGCERAVGWPLIALAGVAEVRGDSEVLAKMRQMVAFLARFTADPDRELEEVTTVEGHPLRWWRICQEDGTKPFMLGVVLEGLERYHRLTADLAARAAIVAICRFLVEVMWVEGIEAFIYEWNAFNRPHREDNYPHYINMMVAPGLAYAYELTGDPQFRQVATRAFHAALWTLFAPGGGKELGMVGRTSALMVGRLYAWRQRDEADRAARLLPSQGVGFSFVGAPQELEQRPELVRREGEPHYEEGMLYSGGTSFAVYGFRDPVNTDRGEISFTFVPDWDCPPFPGPVSQRAYLHLCDRPFTCSCVSVISFYTGLHVRFYDAERHYIEVLETQIQNWKKGKPVAIRIWWDVVAGEAALWLDGEERDRRRLNRRLAGAFKRLHLGHRPGNWRADGKIGELVLHLG